MDLIALKNNKSKQIKKIEIKNRNFIDKREIHESTVKNPWITLYSRGGQNWFKTSKYADIQGRGHTTCSAEQKHAIQYKHCTIKTHSITCLSSYQALILPQESKCSIKNGLGMSLDMIKINIYFEHSKSLKPSPPIVPALVEKVCPSIT